MSIRSDRQRGFTLIELLVALMILTIISVAGYRSLNGVLQTRERVAAETQKWQRLTFFFSRLESDMAQAIPRPVRDARNVVMPEWVGRNVVVDENEAELTFTRAGVADQGAEMLAPQRIGYRFEKNSVVLLRWPALDQHPQAKPVRYPLLEGVRQLKWRYLDGGNNWQEIWPLPGNAASLPRAAELTLTLASGEILTRIFALQ